MTEIERLNVNKKRCVSHNTTLLWYPTMKNLKHGNSFNHLNSDLADPTISIDLGSIKEKGQPH